MFKKTIAILALATVCPVVVLATSGTANAATEQGLHPVAIQIPSDNNAPRKSERQKCLDKMLPQDGVDCLKKLKAKKK